MTDTQVFPDAKHTYIECTHEEYLKEMKRCSTLLTPESWNCEVPNSLGGKPHPQFTVDILGSKITVWVNRKTMTGDKQ